MPADELSTYRPYHEWTNQAHSNQALTQDVMRVCSSVTCLCALCMSRSAHALPTKMHVDLETYKLRSPAGASVSDTGHGCYASASCLDTTYIAHSTVQHAAFLRGCGMCMAFPVQAFSSFIVSSCTLQ